MQIYKEHIKGPESFTATPFRDKALAMHKTCCMCVLGGVGVWVGGWAAFPMRPA